MMPYLRPMRLFEGKPLFDPATDSLARYRILGGALALFFLWFATDQLWRNSLDPRSHDFVAFWAAAKLAISGRPDLAYDTAALHHVQVQVATFPAGRELPFGYMPAFLLLVLPFGLLSFPAAMIAWVALGAAIYLLAIRRLFPEAGLLAIAFPPIVVNSIVGQNGFLTAGLFFGAMTLLDRRPFVAGLLIGCLILKPQLGVLFPVALLASRKWPVIAGAATCSIGLALAGLLVFGMDATTAWIRTVPYFADIARNGTVGWVHLTSVYAAGRQAGLAAGPAFAVNLAVFIAAAMIVWRVWRSEAEMLAKASVLACATTLSASYFFLYDQLILVLPLLWLARKGVHWSILAPLWCLPIVSMIQYTGNAGPINFGPILPAILLLLILRELRSSASERNVPMQTASAGLAAPTPA